VGGGSGFLEGWRFTPIRERDKRIASSGIVTYASIVGVMDAIYQVHRPLQAGRRVDSVPAFNMTFSVN
jgi:hypothetical protein